MRRRNTQHLEHFNKKLLERYPQTIFATRKRKKYIKDIVETLVVEV